MGTTGRSGPIPKRSTERVRRNEDNGPVEHLAVQGEVKVPELGIVGAHPMIVDFWDSLKESGQTKYYEPSDWQFARWTLWFMNDLIWSEKPSAVMLQTINSALSDLLVTEGERRRVRLEIDRAQTEAKVYEAADRFKELLQKAK